jgi:hypothetical protein
MTFYRYEILFLGEEEVSKYHKAAAFLWFSLCSMLSWLVFYLIFPSFISMHDENSEIFNIWLIINVWVYGLGTGLYHIFYSILIVFRFRALSVNIRSQIGDGALSKLLQLQAFKAFIYIITVVVIWAILFSYSLNMISLIMQFVIMVQIRCSIFSY